MTAVLLVAVCYCSYTWAAQLIRVVFNFNTFNCWFRVIRVLIFVFGVPSVSTRGAVRPGDCRSGVLITEEVDGAGDKGWGIPQW